MKQNKLERITEMKMLRKQHNHNELTKYCRIISYYLEIGFFYNEAQKYARYLLRR